MTLESEGSQPLEAVLARLDLTEIEAGHLLREAKTPMDKPVLGPVELTRLDQAVARMAIQLAGRDWRRADGADRDEHPELGQYDLFNKRSGEHMRLATFGDLVRWSEKEYGWQSHAGKEQT